MTTTLSIYWENEINNRYYSAYLHQDLLGDWVVTQTCGSKGTQLGGSKNVYCKNYQAAEGMLNDLMQRRLKRGYQVIDEID